MHERRGRGVVVVVVVVRRLSRGVGRAGLDEGWEGRRGEKKKNDKCGLIGNGAPSA